MEDGAEAEISIDEVVAGYGGEGEPRFEDLGVANEDKDERLRSPEEVGEEREYGGGAAASAFVVGVIVEGAVEVDFSHAIRYFVELLVGYRCRSSRERERERD